jgi:hypothetical protein
MGVCDGGECIMMKKIIFLISLSFLSFVVNSANATLQMAIWDFGQDATDYTLKPATYSIAAAPSLEAGNAGYDINGKNGFAYTDSIGVNHIAGQALAWDDVSSTSGNAYWIMTVNTTGWQNMQISWHYLSDNTGAKLGPTSFDFDYKVGAGSWVSVLNNEPIARDDAWHQTIINLVSITAINNQPAVQFRVNDLDRGDTDGSFLLDNLELTGVPEPATLALLLAGSMRLLVRRSKSKKCLLIKRNN